MTSNSLLYHDVAGFDLQVCKQRAYVALCRGLMSSMVTTIAPDAGDT